MRPELNCLWACSRPMGQYRGIYPGKFIERLNAVIPLDGKLILNQFGGTTKRDPFNHTVDINPDVGPTYNCDARSMGIIPDNTYDVVLADPPYDGQNVNYSTKLYKCEPVAPYSFVNEGVRVLKPGGFYCILHQLVYKKIPGTERYGVIAITTGPNMRIRVLNIFQKVQPQSMPRPGWIAGLSSDNREGGVDAPTKEPDKITKVTLVNGRDS